MNPRRRFLTAKNLDELQLLKKIHIHGSVLGNTCRLNNLFFGKIIKKKVTECFLKKYNLDDKNVDLMILDSPLSIISRIIEQEDQYKYNRLAILDFCRKSSRLLSNDENIYAFSGCALELFNNTSGICILDQTSLLPFDEVELFKKSNQTSISEHWLRHMNFLQERNLKEISRANVVLCLYPQIEESVKKWLPTANTKILMHPCDKPKQKEKQEREKLRFLFAGHKSIVKGLYLIEEWLLNSNKSNNVEFVICGSEGNLPLNALTNKKNIIILGHQTRQQLEYWYSSCDLCVFPEQQNALGNTAFESMEHGTPVLARKNIVIKHGINGFSFENDHDFFEIIDELSTKTSSYFHSVGEQSLLIAQERYENFRKELKIIIEPLVR